ncbi:MAG: M48 family metalloprotease, partial [Dehalococcoidia bacterium]|nr:M48 family metalloprotease [Dehalococcoidia bacterium]
ALGVRFAATPELQTLRERLERLAALYGMPVPRVGIVDDPLPNAFCIGYGLTHRGTRRAVVAVTRGLLDLLEPAELDGVLAHELAHLRNRDAAVLTASSSVALVAGAMGLLVAAFGAVSAWFGQLLARATELLLGKPEQRVGCLRGCLGLQTGCVSLVLLLGAVGALVAAAFYWLFWFLGTLVVLALSRYREFIADHVAALVTGSPGSLAAALQKLDQAHREARRTQAQATATQTGTRWRRVFRPFFVVEPGDEEPPALLSTHPPVSERIRRLIELEQRLAGR